MKRFVVGEGRSQSTLFPERMDDYLGEDNPVRAVDAFVDVLDLADLDLGGVETEATFVVLIQGQSRSSYRLIYRVRSTSILRNGLGWANRPPWPSAFCV